jgi:hypothetical protein
MKSHKNMALLEIGCPYLKWIQLFRARSLVGYFENGKENSGFNKRQEIFGFGDS